MHIIGSVNIDIECMEKSKFFALRQSLKMQFSEAFNKLLHDSENTNVKIITVRAKNMFIRFLLYLF